jgi:hypothetical protein
MVLDLLELFPGERGARPVFDELAELSCSTLLVVERPSRGSRR